MGIGNSREPYGQRPRRRSRSRSRSPIFGILGGKNKRRGSFRRRRHNSTTEPVLPSATRPISYQSLYGSYYANRQFPVYPQVQPISSPFLPISYNNYSAPSNIPPQYMMMLQQQRVAPFMPTPYTPPPISMPYVQQPPMQPAYNNIGGVPAPVPTGMPIGTGIYPPPYSSAPARLITDWTGGGKISPGFLGPPI